MSLIAVNPIGWVSDLFKTGYHRGLLAGNICPILLTFDIQDKLVYFSMGQTYASSAKHANVSHRPLGFRFIQNWIPQGAFGR
jgi:fermentation-respiration switch protein FrsA (DUF1100 family)